jgi:hypothetical protein
MVLIDKQEYHQLKNDSKKYNEQFNPEIALAGVDKLRRYEADVLKSLLQEIKSTKNALLIEEKRYTDPVDIAYRD